MFELDQAKLDSCVALHGLFKSESKALMATELTWYALGVF